MSDSEMNKEKTVSKKQKIANCSNAQKSTGPKTSKSKKITSRNAVKHGLYSGDIIISSPYLKENRAEYEALLSALYDELSPTTDFQEHLVCKIATCYWRSRRAAIAETGIVNYQLKKLDDHHTYNQLSGQLDQIPELPAEPGIVDDMQEKRGEIAASMIDIVKSKTIPQTEQCMRILYYEMRINRQLEHYFRILWNLQGKTSKNIIEPDMEVSS